MDDGISDDLIEQDGLSKRLRYQINFLNLVVGWARFVGEIILKNIPGRQKARDIEDDHIDKYDERPRGNPIGGRKKRNKKDKK